MDNITFVLLISWTNGLKGSGTWCHPGQPGYRYGDLVVAGYAGTRNVTAEIDTFDGVSAGSCTAARECRDVRQGGRRTSLVPGRSGLAPRAAPGARDQAAVRMPLLAPMAAPPPEFSFHRPKPQVRDLSGAAGLIHLLAHQLQQLGLRRRHPGKVPVPIRPPAPLPGR
jgi:hypothetical protein